MTYLMPNTYKKLAKYAQDPDKIPDGDAELLKLTCKLTAEVEFDKEQLNAFQKLIQQEHISSAELAGNDIVQCCMAQGNFPNIDSYINSDNRLKEVLTVQTDTYIAAKIAEVRGKLAVLKENKEQAGKPVAEKSAAAVERREQQEPNKLNTALLNRMREQKMDGKP